MAFRVMLVMAANIAMVFAQADDSGCVMSEWSEWGPCVAGGQEAPESGGDEGTYNAEPETGGDVGREMMGVLTAAKLNQWSMRDECQQDNTCPQYNARPSQLLRPVPCIDEMSGDYPCHLIDMMSHISIEDLGYTEELQTELEDYRARGNDIWGWTDEWTRNEYAIVGTSGGTSFVDVSDPLRPRVLAFLQTRTDRSGWRDIKVYNNTAYIVSEASYHGMQIFDLLRLRDMTEMEYVEPDSEYLMFGNSHNIVANEESGFLYSVGCRQRFDEYADYVYEPCKGGLHMIDARTDRLHPTYVGCYEDDGYTHDAQCVTYHGPHQRFQGREICFNYNEDTLTIVDVTDKSMPELLAKVGYTGSAYTHQGWITEDHTIILLDDEVDEYRTGLQTHTYIWDVSKLTKPYLRSLYKSAEYAIDHNQYIRGDIAYQSNYGAGLRMLHIDAANFELREVAYFDVLPTSRPTPAFEGTWSNYPYFESGNVIISSIEYGLFVVRPNFDAIQRDIDSNHILYEQQRTRTTISAPPGAVCPSEVQPRECTP